MPVAAPTTEESLYPCLWHFWRQIPPERDVTVFDCSWYGRVLVEPVEGLASDDDWQRAYEEINAFEADLARHGAILIKVFLEVSRDEQRRRFEKRERKPHKRHKLTRGDWRNFGKRSV